MPRFQSVRSLPFGLALCLSFQCSAASAQQPAATNAPTPPANLSSLPAAPTAATGSGQTASPYVSAAHPAASQTVPATQTGTAPDSAAQAPTATTPAPTAASGQAAPAQAPATPNQPAGDPDQQANDSGSFTLKTSVNEVNLIFTVTDKHGHFINNLQPKDFALLDDQKPPAQLYSFTQQTNLPLRVGLLIDTSTSIRLRFKFEQQAATEFLLEVLRPRTDRAFIMGFNAKAYITQDYTNDPDRLEAGVNKLEPAGGTALYDSVYTACRDKLLTAAPTQATVRKALIVVSDGDDNQSRAYLDDAIKMCQRAQAIVYTISTNTSPTRDRGDETLEKISLATGGTAFFPKRMEDIANNFKAVQDELRSQYALAYKPSDFKTDGSFRTIYFEALDRRYTVRAQKGYFATK